jgi:hypothetical protein
MLNSGSMVDKALCYKPELAIDAGRGLRRNYFEQLEADVKFEKAVPELTLDRGGW